jgi:hypothetical protein
MTGDNRALSVCLYAASLALWRGTSVRLRRGEAQVIVFPIDETGTTMLSVAAHIRQAKVRKSKPGLSGSRQERIIGASQFAQNGRSLVALPWKNEGTERSSIRLLLVGGSATLSVTDSCRDRAVITQHDVSDRDSMVNIDHFQRFKAATNYGGHTSPRNAYAYPTLAQLEVADAALLFRCQRRP